jgi:hypothetical protein
MLGRDFRLTQQRGQWFTTESVPNVPATIDLAFVLIQDPDHARSWTVTILDDLREVRRRLSSG